MAEHDFYTRVLSALGEMKAEQASTTTEVRNIVARLDKLNGTVARHEERLNQMQIEVAERRNQCPLVDAVELRLHPVENFVVAEESARKTSASWLKWLWPVIWAGVGALAVLVLLHAESMLKLKGS